MEINIPETTLIIPYWVCFLLWITSLFLGGVITAKIFFHFFDSSMTEDMKPPTLFVVIFWPVFLAFMLGYVINSLLTWFIRR